MYLLPRRNTPQPVVVDAFAADVHVTEVADEVAVRTYIALEKDGGMSIDSGDGEKDVV